MPNTVNRSVRTFWLDVAGIHFTLSLSLACYLLQLKVILIFTYFLFTSFSLPPKVKYKLHEGRDLSFALVYSLNTSIVHGTSRCSTTLGWMSESVF